jgi:hypothetical protein
MSGGLDLEQRYRHALRLLPGYYRDQWEQDMVAAFLDSWLTGDPEEDDAILEFCKPSWSEVASVAALAVRLYLGGAASPGRYFTRGQAVRGAVLAMALVHALVGLNAVVFLTWSRRVLGLPAAPASLAIAPSVGLGAPTVFYLADYAWVVIFVALVLGHYRTARIIAMLAIVPDLAWLLEGQVNRDFPAAPVGPWAFWALINLAPVLAMAAFHRDAPPAARRPWLAALPASYLLVAGPELALQASGNSAWLPDPSGLFCLLVSVACLVHAPRALSRRAVGSGVWSLTLTLLGVVAGAYRIASLNDFRRDPHLIAVSLAELLIMAVTVALVAPDAARTQSATPAPPARPHPR